MKKVVGWNYAIRDGDHKGRSIAELYVSNINYLRDQVDVGKLNVEAEIAEEIEAKYDEGKRYRNNHI